ncbi:MAG: hypothetical protein NTX64_09440 [Elusimicrobia bacterium]|nr:hypothetical protein [Elusimicrobiota bacterium]
MLGNLKRSLVFMAAFASFAVVSLKRPTAAQLVEPCGNGDPRYETASVVCSTSPVNVSTSTATAPPDSEGGCCG